MHAAEEASGRYQGKPKLKPKLKSKSKPKSKMALDQSIALMAEMETMLVRMKGDIEVCGPENAPPRPSPPLTLLQNIPKHPKTSQNIPNHSKPFQPFHNISIG
jgi:hypothetical protein